MAARGKRDVSSYAERLRSYFEDYLLVLGEARRGLPKVLVLMFVVAALDLLGISLIAPLVQLIASGSTADFLPSLGTRPRLVFLLLGGLLVAVFAIKGWLSYYLYRRIVLFSEGHRARLMDRLVGAYQAMDWQSFVSRNTADVIAQTHAHTSAYSGGTLTASLLLTTNAIVFAVLFVLLSTQDFSVVLVVLACMGLYSAMIHRPLQKAQTESQRRTLEYYAKSLGAVSQALGAMREVRVLGHESHFRAEVGSSAQQMAEAISIQTSLSHVPRVAIEVAMILVIVIVAGLRFASEGTAGPMVPTLALFAAAGVRMIPAATTIAANLGAMRSTRFVLRDLAQELSILKTGSLDRGTAEDLAARNTATAAEPFKELSLKDVRFAYRGAKQPALESVNLTILAGETVGLMGKSGAGKSTLADVILGLLVPQGGQVLVNGRSIHEDLRAWLRHAAYIPQAPYLLDDTVARNIVFGMPEARVDAARLDEVVDRVQLRQVVDGLPQGLHTRVGERGATLSGGQRQRLALARALYQGRQFLILDEATSALDEDTERDVLVSVRSLHGRTTMLIIAHNERTLAICDRIERL
ncbi:MAG TPA: ABC transporter ATP-binding protein [Burkholderiales bacterium]|nr:ABC transporter ATP-binding protein [Burkholderiales bacterium]